jgi:hypothetical protein
MPKALKQSDRKTTTGSMSAVLLRKVRIVGAHLGISNTMVLDRFAGPVIDKALRRLEAGKHVELGENGAA